MNLDVQMSWEAQAQSFVDEAQISWPRRLVLCPSRSEGLKVRIRTDRTQGVGRAERPSDKRASEPEKRQTQLKGGPRPFFAWELV